MRSIWLRLYPVRQGQAGSALELPQPGAGWPAPALIDGSPACFVPITVVLELEWHRQGLDFAAAPHLVRSEGCGALVSFDRALVRAAAELKLTPIVHTP